MQGVSMASVVALLDQLLPHLQHLTQSHNVANRTQNLALDLLFAVGQADAAACGAEAGLQE